MFKNNKKITRIRTRLDNIIYKKMYKQKLKLN